MMPDRDRAVLGMWAWETALSLAGSLPAALRAAYGHHPEGDAPLVDPGSAPTARLLHVKPTACARQRRLRRSCCDLARSRGQRYLLRGADDLGFSATRAVARSKRVAPVDTLRLWSSRRRACLMRSGHGLALVTGFLGIAISPYRSSPRIAQQLAVASGSSRLLALWRSASYIDLAPARSALMSARRRAIVLGLRALRTAPISRPVASGGSPLPLQSDVVDAATDLMAGGGLSLLGLARSISVVASRSFLRASCLVKTMRTVDRVSDETKFFRIRPRVDVSHFEASN